MPVLNNHQEATSAVYKELSDKFVGNMPVAIRAATYVFLEDRDSSIDSFIEQAITMGRERTFCADVHVICYTDGDVTEIGDLTIVEGTREYIRSVRDECRTHDATLLVISYESVMSGDVTKTDYDALCNIYEAVLVQCNPITKELPIIK